MNATIYVHHLAIRGSNYYSNLVYNAIIKKYGISLIGKMWSTLSKVKGSHDSAETVIINQIKKSTITTYQFCYVYYNFHMKEKIIIRHHDRKTLGLTDNLYTISKESKIDLAVKQLDYMCNVWCYDMLDTVSIQELVHLIHDTKHLHTQRNIILLAHHEHKQIKYLNPETHQVLPDEILLYIFEYIGPIYLPKLSQVCQAWRSCVNFIQF